MSVGERTAATPARFLGDGTIKLVFKRYMFAEDKNVGRVYVPMDAAFPKYSNCDDLRINFHINDEVVFTAVRSNSTKNNPYSACSIIHKKDLILVTGKVMEICDKYAYVDAPRYGRIFAPFSARTDGGRPWHGKAAEVGRNITMKILPQPEFQKCGHVAFAICDKTVPTFSSSNGMSTDSKNERQPDSVSEQFGIVVELPTKDVDGLIYSQTTGAIAIPKKIVLVEFEVGTFVYFNAQKAVSEHHDKCVWRATHLEIIGKFSFLESDYLFNRFVNTNTESCLTVDTYALVCRVSESNASAWLWNDLFGRIFVNNHYFITDMHALDVVQVKAQYTAAFEDVPWSAIHVRRVHEGQNKLRAKYGQLLQSDDGWHVNHVCEQCNGGFYGFLEHKVHGAAFMAWTDLNQGERPPTKGSNVRVTGYIQLRDRKHPWRALLVTPYDESGNVVYSHQIYKTTGEFHPEIKAAIDSLRAKNSILTSPPMFLSSPVAPIAPVSVTKPITPTQKVVTVPSQPLPQAWNGTGKQTSSSTTSIDSGRASITSIAAINNESSTGTAPGTPLTISTPGVIDGPPPGFGSPARSVLSSGRNSVTPIGSERAVNLQQNGTPSPPAPPTVNAYNESSSNGTVLRGAISPKTAFDKLFTPENSLGLFGPWRDNNKSPNGGKAWPKNFVDTRETPLSSTPVNGVNNSYSRSSDTNTNSTSFSRHSTIFDELLTLRAPLSSEPNIPSQDFLVLDTSQPPLTTPAPIAPPINSTRRIMKAQGEPSSEAIAIANMLRIRQGSDTEYENFLYEQVVQRPHLVVRILRTPDAMLLADALKSIDENDVKSS